MAISKFGKWAIALAAGLAVSTAANAQDKKRDYSKIYNYDVSENCERIISTPTPTPAPIIHPAPTPYVAPAVEMVPVTKRVPVTTMVPITTYEERTTYQEITTMVPKGTEGTYGTTTSSTYTYPSTPTYTHTSPILGDGQCQIQGTNQTVPCPDAESYTTGTSYAPHTSGTYTGEVYPSGSITEGTTYTPHTSWTYTGYTAPTYNSGTIPYYSNSVDNILAGKK